MCIDEFDSLFDIKEEPEERITQIEYKNKILEKLIFDGLIVEACIGFDVRNSRIDSAVYTLPTGKPFCETLFIRDLSGKEIIKKTLKRFYKVHGWNPEEYRADFSLYRRKIIEDSNTKEEFEVLKRAEELRKDLIDWKS